MQTDIERSESMGQATKERLRRYVKRAEMIEAEIAERQADRREIWAQVKSGGFDLPVFKRAVAERKIEADKRDNRDALTELYLDIAAAV